RPSGVGPHTKYRFYYTGIRVRDLSRSPGILHEGPRHAGSEQGDDAARRQVRPPPRGRVPPETRTELVSAGHAVPFSVSNRRGDGPPGVPSGRRRESVPRTDPEGSDAGGASGKGGGHGNLR